MQPVGLMVFSRRPQLSVLVTLMHQCASRSLPATVCLVVELWRCYVLLGAMCHLTARHGVYGAAHRAHRDDCSAEDHNAFLLSRAAHIFGGTVPEFRALAEACANWTLTDRQAGIKAVWDDESYLQRCAA